MDQLITDLLNATAPPFPTQYSSLAADGTAIESPYRRRSRAKDGRPDVAQGQLPVDASESAPAVATPGWPRVGVDGRAQHTVDPDPREGYRSPKPGQTKVYIGYEPTTLCDVPAIGARSRYTLIRAIAMRPAGSDRCEAGLAAVDTLPSPPEELIVDRGYSYTKEFGAGLVHRGIEMVADLHKNQRTTRPGPRAGTVSIDGQLFTAAVHQDQRSLATFPQGATQDERLAVAATYDKRSAYAFKPFGRPRSSGSQRFRGPALEGRVRCVNTPASMRKPETAKRPTTNCVPGRPCGCGITVTLPVRDYARTHQTKTYGTTAWLKSYGRRVAIESSNAELRTNRVQITKRSFLVRGRTGVALLFGILCAATNTLGLADWYNETWLDLLTMTTEPPKYARKPARQEATHRLRTPRSDE